MSAVCGPLCCTFDLPNPKSEALGQSGSRFFLSVHSNLPRWQGWWRRPRGLVFSHFSLVWAICTCRQQCRNSTLTELPVLTTLNVPNVPHHHDACVNTHSVNIVHSHSNHFFVDKQLWLSAPCRFVGSVSPFLAVSGLCAQTALSTLTVLPLDFLSQLILARCPERLRAVDTRVVGFLRRMRMQIRRPEAFMNLSEKQ